MKYCPVCGCYSVERAGDAYGKCGQCSARVYMLPTVPLDPRNRDLIARLLQEARADLGSTLEVSPEPKADQ